MRILSCYQHYLVTVAMVAGMVIFPNAWAGSNETGRAVYEKSCIACHGADGEGMMPGVPDLATRDSAMKKPEAELVRNVIQGFKSPGSQMAMPPNGGNPELTKQEATSAIRYMRKAFMP